MQLGGSVADFDAEAQLTFCANLAEFMGNGVAPSDIFLQAGARQAPKRVPHI